MWCESEARVRPPFAIPVALSVSTDHLLVQPWVSAMRGSSGGVGGMRDAHGSWESFDIWGLVIGFAAFQKKT